MKTQTELQIEYTYFSWKYDFPEHVEIVLEEDYVINHHLYSENSLKRVSTLLLIDPEACASSIIKAARG